MMSSQKFFALNFILSIGLGGLSALQAQTPAPKPSTATQAESADAPQFEPAPQVPLPADAAPQSGSMFKDERDRLLKVLATEIEPNLPRADIEKLTRSVMRLGSYRKDWVEKGQEFLLANAPLAELYLYRFSQVKNKRLNQKIVETLAQFPSYRFPKAPLAFVEFLTPSKDDKIAFLRLLEQVAVKQPLILNDSVQLLSSAWGQDLSTEERLYFANLLCNKFSSSSADARQTVRTWVSSATGFWETIVAAELNACFRGA